MAYRSGGWDKIEYWLSLPMPVLIVRYREHNNCLYVTWLHDQMRHLEFATTDQAAIRFDERDRLTAVRAKELRIEVAKAQDLRAGHIQWPLRVWVESVIGPKAALSAALIETKGLQVGLSHAIEFRVGKAPVGEAALRVLPESVEFSLGAGIGASIEEPGETFVQSTTLAKDLLALVAAALASVGADHVVVAFLERTGGTQVGSIALGLAAVRAGRPDLALALAEQLVQVDEVAGCLLCLSATPPTERTPALVERASKIFRTAIGRAAPDQRASMEYNFANWLRSRQHPDALAQYKRVGDAYPEYRERSYYWGEYAGVLFGADDFARAEAAYRRAIELGDPSGRCRTLHADSLLALGRYDEAWSEFSRAIRDSERPDPFAVLGQLTASHARLAVGEAQIRQPDAAENLAARIRSGEVEENVDAVENLFTLDALCPAGWFIVSRRSEPVEKVIFARLIWAFLIRNNAQAWAMAVLGILEHDPDGALTRAAIEFADFMVGDELEVEVLREAEDFRVAIEAAGETFYEDNLAELLGRLRNIVSEGRQPRDLTVRIHTQEAAV